jgi:hypothetical protein
LRRIGLDKTNFAKTTCGTIRLQLLKIGALVTISIRRIKIAMASGYLAAVTLGTCSHSSCCRGKRSRFARLARGAASRHPRGIIRRPIGNSSSSLQPQPRKNPRSR